jgi:Flp pilus assembly pilin Flp
MFPVRILLAGVAHVIPAFRVDETDATWQDVARLFGVIALILNAIGLAYPDVVISKLLVGCAVGAGSASTYIFTCLKGEAATTKTT